jgi:hypothetical protein
MRAIYPPSQWLGYVIGDSSPPKDRHRMQIQSITYIDRRTTTHFLSSNERPLLISKMKATILLSIACPAAAWSSLSMKAEGAGTCTECRCFDDDAPIFNLEAYLYPLSLHSTGNSRRGFITKAAGLVAGTVGLTQASQAYTLPDLPYPFEALEPHIDTPTMKIHHDKHHGKILSSFGWCIR